MYHPGAIRSRPLVITVMLLALTAAMFTVIPKGIQTVVCSACRICKAVENYLLWRICPSLNNGPDWGTVDLSSLDYSQPARTMG